MDGFSRGITRLCGFGVGKEAIPTGGVIRSVIREPIEKEENAMVNRSITPSDEEYSPRRKVVSWGAFAGAFIALALQSVFVLLGQSIGFPLVNSTIGTVPVVGFGAGSTIWWVATFVISLFVGGWFAGRLAGNPNRAVGSWNGVAAWGVAMLVLLAFLATPLGSVAGGSLNVLNRAAYVTSGVNMASAAGVSRRSAAAASARAGAGTTNSVPGARRAAAAAFVMMFLGGIASAAGGATGAPRPVRPYPSERAAVHEEPAVETTREVDIPVIR